MAEPYNQSNPHPPPYGAPAAFSSGLSPEGQLDALFAVVFDGTAFYDTDGRLVRINDALRRLLGLDQWPEYSEERPYDRLARLHLRDHQGAPLPPEAWPHTRALRGEVLVGQDAVETWVTTLDGRELFLSTSASPVRNREGHIVGALCVTRDLTERWRLLQDLALRVRQIDAIFDAIPDGLGFFDAKGTPIRFNSAARALFGADRHEPLEAIPAAYDVRTLNGEQVPLEEMPLTRALRGEVSDPTDLLVRTAEGYDQVVTVQAAPWFDQHGKLEGVVVVAHDITSLRMAERDAAAKAAELEAIFEAITDSVYVLGADARILRMNAAAKKLLGLDRLPQSDNLSTEELREAMAPRDARGNPLAPEQWPVSRVLRGEILTGEHAADMTMNSLDGRTLQVSVTGAPVRDARGQLLHAVALLRDVTERRQLEQRTHAALNALLAMAQALVLPHDQMPQESGSAGSLVGRRLVNLTRDVLGCRRVALTTWDLALGIQHPVAVAGLSAEQERAWFETIEAAPINDPALRFDPALLASLMAGEPLVLDMTAPPHNQMPNPFAVVTVLTAPLMINGTIVGTLSMDYGAQAHQYSAEEIAVGGAVAQLAAITLERERLWREREEARAVELALRETNQRMDEFLSIASHELKSPLTGIRGNVQLVRRRLQRASERASTDAAEMQTLIAPLLEMLSQTEQQIARQARMINDLLDVSRIRASHLELYPQPCDLASIVTECVEEQQRTSKNRVLMLRRPDQPLMVIADDDRLRQVVSNYLSNALKYSPPQQPVEIELRVDDQQARVQVRDQGPGLTPEQQQYIWERYRRVPGMTVHDSAQAEGGGLGLGLYISKTIIELHGGTVGVTSAPGQGTTFWFTLPLQ